MLTDELVALVKTNLKLDDASMDLTIKDVIQDALNYCNLDELPEETEPYVRKKVKSIMNYEAQYSEGAVTEIKSITVGDTSTTFNVGDITRETVYGLTANDKEVLKQFRRTRK